MLAILVRNPGPLLIPPVPTVLLPKLTGFCSQLMPRLLSSVKETDSTTPSMSTWASSTSTFETMLVSICMSCLLA